MAFLAPSAFSRQGPFYLTIPATAFKLCTFLPVSVVAGSKQLGFFLPCTVFGILNLHPTQDWYVSTPCQVED